MVALLGRNKSADRVRDGARHLPAPTPKQAAQLRDLQVPLIDLPDPCRTCDDPCEGEDAYAKLDIDITETPLLGSMNEYGRMVVCSTGVKDWAKEVTEVKGSLAELLDHAYTKRNGKAAKGKDAGLGVYPSSLECRRAKQPTNRKITLLNGSQLSPDHQNSACFVFPDYKIVQGIASTAQDASALVSTALSPEIEPVPSLSTGMSFRSWPLAYRAVILLCSHKRRDKRCHIVAPLLRAEFIRALEAEGLDIDERGDEAEHGPEPCMEDWTEADEEAREARYERARRKAATSSTVGIFNVSHIGGHRYAGNALLCFPSGASVWYGRVSPREVEAIVRSRTLLGETLRLMLAQIKETVMGGRIIAELLRGGIGLGGKAGPDGVLAW